MYVSFSGRGDVVFSDVVRVGEIVHDDICIGGVVWGVGGIVEEGSGGSDPWVCWGEGRKFLKQERVDVGSSKHQKNWMKVS